MPIGIYKRTQKHKEQAIKNLSKVKKRDSLGKKWKENIGKSIKKHWKTKRKNWKHSISTREKIRKSHLGKKQSEETKQKKRNYWINYWDERGRKEKRPQHDRWEYLFWKKKVFERDSWACQFCGKRGHLGLGERVELNAHHIKGWAGYPKLRFDVNNGITLCKDCHKLTHYGRKNT